MGDNIRLLRYWLLTVGILTFVIHFGGIIIHLAETYADQAFLASIKSSIILMMLPNLYTSILYTLVGLSLIYISYILRHVTLLRVETAILVLIMASLLILVTSSSALYSGLPIIIIAFFLPIYKLAMKYRNLHAKHKSA